MTIHVRQTTRTATLVDRPRMAKHALEAPELIGLSQRSVVFSAIAASAIRGAGKPATQKRRA